MQTPNDQRPEEEPRYVSGRELQLELRALRAEQAAEHKSTRLWLVGAVAASGLLTHISLPGEVGVPTAFAVLAAVIAKAVFFK